MSSGPARSVDKVWRQLRRLFGTLRYAWRILWDTAPVLSLVVAVGTVAQGVVPVAVLCAMRLLLDAVNAALEAGGRDGAFAGVVKAAAIQLGCLLLAACVSRLVGYASACLGRNVALHVRAEGLGHIAKLDLQYFDNAHFHDMVDRALTQDGGSPAKLVNDVAQVVKFTAQTVSMGIVLVSLRVWLPALIVLLGLPSFFAKLKLGCLRYEILYKRAPDARMASRLSQILTSKNTVPEIRSFRATQLLSEKWRGFTNAFLAQDQSMDWLTERTLLLVDGLLLVGQAAMTIYVAYIGLISVPSVTVGQIMMYAGAFTKGANAIQWTLSHLAEIRTSSLFLGNLVEFRRLEPRIETATDGIMVPEHIDTVEVRNVSFRYPGRPSYSLRNVSLTIQRSESLLIVGPNGAGKSTLVKLLLRLYDPQEGVILLNGRDLRQYDIRSLRDAVGVAFQEFIRYPLTVRENIGLGRVACINDMPAVARATRRAGALPIVEALPHGYETVLSKEFRGGQELSVGEWQRICLARVFLKEAPVLLFDEPTARVDVETEASLLREMGQLASDRLCVMISHRSFKKGIADRIAVMDNGEIVENGSYEELLAAEGTFARLRELFLSAPLYGELDRTIVPDETTD